MENRSVLPVGITLWFIVATFYTFFNASPLTSVYSDLMAFVIEVVLDAVAFYCCFSLFKKATNDGKGIYIWFTLSFVFLFISDFFYFTGNRFAWFHPSDLLSKFTLVVFFFCQAIAWLKWLKANNSHGDDVHQIVNILMWLAVLVMLAVFFLGFHRDFAFFEHAGMYPAIEVVMQMIVFVIIMLALARMACPMMKMSAIGMLILMVANFGYSEFSVSVNVIDVSNLQTVWMLGILLMTLGFVQQKNELY